MGIVRSDMKRIGSRIARSSESRFACRGRSDLEALEWAGVNERRSKGCRVSGGAGGIRGVGRLDDKGAVAERDLGSTRHQPGLSWNGSCWHSVGESDDGGVK